MQEGTGHYLDEATEQLIIRALRHAVRSGEFLGAEAGNAIDYADALENDTFLLETVTSPE